MDTPQDPYQAPNTAAAATPPGMPPVRSGIPKVFGIIHIIYAAIGGILALVGLGGGAMLKTTMEPIKAEAEKSGQDISGFTESIDSIISASMIQSACSVVFAILLIIAGIQLVRYKAAGRKLSNIWAIARIVVAIPVTMMVMGAQTELQEEIQKLSGANAGLNMAAMMSAGGIIGILLISIYPVLSLIFVNQQKAKDSLS